jgi:magnesium transporter
MELVEQAACMMHEMTGRQESVMKTLYEIKQGSLVATEESTAVVVVYTSPDEAERQELVNTLHLPRHDLESALDPDEISRVEFTPEYTYMIWKRPNNVSFEQQLKFEVSSVGLVLQRDKLTIITGEGAIPLDGGEFRKVGSLNSVVLKAFLQTIHHYFGHLKGIKMLTAELQAKMNVSQDNTYLLQMFSLGESLIYYLNAIEGNASVLTKLRANAERMGISKEDLEMMDDVIIEHQQCNRQTQIYSSVLSELMDARGNIINNNMNVLLKNLTTINVVFLPLNLIAGIGGMSEYSMMTNGVNWRIAYGFFLLTMIALGWLTWILLRRQMAGTGIHFGRRNKKRHILG